MPFNIDFGKIGDAIGTGLQSIGTYSAQAAAQANSVSRQAQSAQGAFNQASANQANMINDQSMANQMGFNSAMMNMANQYNTGMWERAASWNEDMWEKQAEFNAAEAQKNRDWQTQMANTAYQRAVKDMESAGLNPILAVTGGGIGGASVPSGSVASVGGAQMSSANAQMASAGLLGANTASESNFTGQMEQMSSTLALIGAIFSGISSATEAAGGLGDIGEEVIKSAGSMLEKTGIGEAAKDSYNRREELKKDIKNGDWWDSAVDFVKSAWKDRPGGWVIDQYNNKHITNKVTESQYLRQNDYNKTWEKYHKPKG